MKTLLPWQQWAIAGLGSGLATLGGGAYVQLYERVNLIEQRQVHVIEDLSAIKNEVGALRATDQLAIQALQRIERKLDDHLSLESRFHK